MSSTRLSFRKALETDVPFVKFLRNQTMPEHYERVGRSYETEEQYERIAKRYEMAQIIQYEVQDIGFLKVDRTLSPWEMVQIQILPAFQGRGFGTVILETLIEEAHACKQSISLHVLKGNPAREFYERLGFRVITEEETSYLMLRE